MPLEDSEVKWLILDLLKAKSERDGQRLVGPSEIGNPCLHCLANRMLESTGGPTKEPGKYWLGAKIGTAIHAELEQEERKHVADGEGKFKPLKDALIESPIVLHTIVGYGTIKAKPDLVLVHDQHLIDHKTTSKTKLQHYKLDGVPQQYVIQQNLYAYGLNRSGVPIKRISLSFINREGASDNDINIFSFDYDEKIAVDALDRLQSLWDDLQTGKTPDDLPSDPLCYYCSRVIGRV
jgi:hypothetical protein